LKVVLVVLGFVKRDSKSFGSGLRGKRETLTIVVVEWMLRMEKHLNEQRMMDSYIPV
jgi:hypothetical protein